MSLGLETLHLSLSSSYGKMRVLDPIVVAQALALLEHLHAGGRRVGVISHVEELKERIAAKVEVGPTGQGTSEVRVVVSG